MGKLIWKDVTHCTEIGSTDNLCNIDVYEANTEIKYDEDVIFAFGVSVFSETDLETGEQIITASYSPQGLYNDVYVPLDAADTRYASIEDAKKACEDKVKEIFEFLYVQLEPHINRLACSE